MNIYEFLSIMFLGTTVLLDVITRAYNALKRKANRPTGMDMVVDRRRKECEEENKRFPERNQWIIPPLERTPAYKLWPLKELWKTIKRKD